MKIFYFFLLTGFLFFLSCKTVNQSNLKDIYIDNDNKQYILFRSGSSIAMRSCPTGTLELSRTDKIIEGDNTKIREACNEDEKLISYTQFRTALNNRLQSIFFPKLIEIRQSDIEQIKNEISEQKKEISSYNDILKTFPDQKPENCQPGVPESIVDPFYCEILEEQKAYVDAVNEFEQYLLQLESEGVNAKRLRDENLAQTMRRFDNVSSSLTQYVSAISRFIFDRNKMYIIRGSRDVVLVNSLLDEASGDLPNSLLAFKFLDASDVLPNYYYDEAEGCHYPEKYREQIKIFDFSFFDRPDGDVDVQFDQWNGIFGSYRRCWEYLEIMGHPEGKIVSISGLVISENDKPKVSGKIVTSTFSSKSTKDVRDLRLTVYSQAIGQETRKAIKQLSYSQSYEISKWGTIVWPIRDLVVDNNSRITAELSYTGSKPVEYLFGHIFAAELEGVSCTRDYMEKFPNHCQIKPDVCYNIGNVKNKLDGCIHIAAGSVIDYLQKRSDYSIFLELLLKSKYFAQGARFSALTTALLPKNQAFAKYSDKLVSIYKDQSLVNQIVGSHLTYGAISDSNFKVGFSISSYGGRVITIKSGNSRYAKLSNGDIEIDSTKISIPVGVSKADQLELRTASDLLLSNSTKSKLDSL